MKQYLQNQNPGETIELFSALFEEAIDGIIIINKGAIIEAINSSGAHTFGYDPEEVVGQNVKMLMPLPYRTEHDGYIKNHLDTGEKKIIGIGREVEGKKKDGSTFPFRLGVSRFNVGDKLYFAGIIHDLSQEKKAQEEIMNLNVELENRVEERTLELADVINKLLDANKRLNGEIKERKLIEAELAKALEREKELGELKSRFVSTASHEFRTPLSAILSSAGLIGRYTETEGQIKREKHIQRIKSAVNHLNGILDDFLSLSKLEEGKTAHKPEEIQLSEFLEKVMDQAKDFIKKGQEIVLIGDPGNQICTLDQGLLKKALFNLISNASKYSEDDQKIELKVTVDERLILEVKDYGMGIPEKDQTFLFERFFRANNAQNIKGTGLGLNIVGKYLEIMNGNISFQSQEGIGTTFTIDLPMHFKP